MSTTPRHWIRLRLLLRRGSQALLASVSLGMAWAACLPGDDRPEPARVQVDVEESVDAKEGFVTDDGWTIRFERFVTAVGALGIGDDVEGDSGCVDYSLTFYDRLFDFAVAGPSRLHLHFGLGQCAPRYRVGSPTEFTLLMEGVSEADRELLQDPAVDQVFGDGSVDEDELEDEERGIGLLAIGEATHEDGRVIRFDWKIRSNFAHERCLVGPDEPFQIDLDSGDDLTIVAEMRPRELFREVPALDAPLVFERYAEADEDGDGTITREELASITVDSGPILEAWADELPESLLPDDAAGQIDLGIVLLIEQIPTLDLQTVVEAFLFPRIAAYEGVGECEVVTSGVRNFEQLVEEVDPPDE